MSWERSEQQKRGLFRELALDDKIELENEALDDVFDGQISSKSQGRVITQDHSLRRSQSTNIAEVRPQNLRPTVSFDRTQSMRRLPDGGKSPLVSSKQSADSTLEGIKTSSKSKPLAKVQAKTIGKAMPSGRGTKRKRDKPVQMLPEKQQVLKGFHFFFVREYDLDPRKTQIRKSKEWGAVREEQWNDDVTHIIADREFSYKQLVEYVKENVVDPIPDKVSIVYYNEFVIDCVKFGPRDGHLPCYRLDGYKEYVAANPESHDANQVCRQGGLSEERAPPEPPKIEQNLGRLRDVVGRNSPDNEPESLAVSSLPSSGHAFNDELDQVIEEAKAIQDLPLDFDDDDEPSTIASEESSNSSDEEGRRPNSLSKTRSFPKSNSTNFACMSKSDGTSKAENPNAHTIETLQKMSDVYSRLNDTWRTLAYRKAISQLKKQTSKITTREEAQQLPFVGERLALKIQEIATTNRLLRLENAMLEPEEKALQTFLGIYGVGAAQAHKWIEQGHRTLADLKNHDVALTTNQTIGLEHYEDFASRISREEMSAHDDFVRRFASKIDKGLEFTIGGSYRRGEQSSGDIDFIVTKAGADAGTIATIMLDRVIPLLIRAGYLQVGLSTASHHSSGESGSKWHGACVLPLSAKATTADDGKAQPWRRIDFLFTAHDCIGAALLYFTGNDIFNRSMRLLASKKGMRLNQRGLYKDVIRGPGRMRLTEGTKVEGFDERKIFEALGVPWREPGERRC